LGITNVAGLPLRRDFASTAFQLGQAQHDTFQMMFSIGDVQLNKVYAQLLPFIDPGNPLSKRFQG